MIDQIYDRRYQAARGEMNAAIAAGLRRFGTAAIKAFKVLNRIEYDAPWVKKPRSASFH